MLYTLQVFNKCKTHGRLVIISLRKTQKVVSVVSCCRNSRWVCVLTFVVSTPPYLALTLGSWMVRR